MKILYNFFIVYHWTKKEDYDTKWQEMIDTGYTFTGQRRGYNSVEFCFEKRIYGDGKILRQIN